MTDAREAAATNLLMHDQGTTYGEQLAEQIIEQFKDAAKTTALAEQAAWPAWWVGGAAKSLPVPSSAA